MTALAGLSGAALIVAALGAWADLRSRRIPNWLTLPAAGFGLLLSLALEGRTGLLSSSGGMGLALILLLPGYLGRVMGAGDVKLMAAVGALLGFRATLIATLAALVAGGAIALGVAVRHRAVGATLRGAVRLAGSIAARAVKPHATAPATTGLRSPFGLAILAGTAFTVWFVSWH